MTSMGSNVQSLVDGLKLQSSTYRVVGLGTCTCIILTECDRWTQSYFLNFGFGTILLP